VFAKSQLEFSSSAFKKSAKSFGKLSFDLKQEKRIAGTDIYEDSKGHNKLSMLRQFVTVPFVTCFKARLQKIP
jgi:hypothetical protein